MKFCLRSLLLFLFILPAASHASTTAPSFMGNTLVIDGDTYTWTSPAIETGTMHSDTYTDANGQTVTITGRSGDNRAMVYGPNDQTTPYGHVLAGEYEENHQAFVGDGSWVVNGVSYTHRDMEKDFTMQPDAFGGLYLDTAGHDDYSGPDGMLHMSFVGQDTNHTFSGGKVPFSGRAATEDIVLFGNTYHFLNSSSSSWSDTYSWTDSYGSSLDGGTLQVQYSNGSSLTDTYSLAVWSPHWGSVVSNAFATVPNGSLDGITWQARTAPTFANVQLWMDGKLLNWQSGTITSAGLVTDTYSGAGITMTISSLGNDYFVDGDNAVVSITSTGGGSGTMAHNGTFTLSGHVLQNAEPNHSAPLFTGAATILRVLGTNYAFTGGFQDTLGNRTDVFANPSFGMLMISGSTSNPNSGTVWASRSGYISTGTYNGLFTMAGMLVSKPTTQPSIYGPPAFWVRGELYLQNATTPTNYASAAGHSLTLSGTTTWTLAGTDGVGAFTGVCSHDPVGVFVVNDALGASTVPVLPANADGSLHLSWSGPPTGMPPAVIENCHTLVFLGTATDDISPGATAAYYGSAVISDQTPWLLKLRTDGSDTTPYTATFTDYSTATSTTGSYSTQTHLFQTSAVGNGFPVPVYGVDPNTNFALWGLSLPDSATSLPATFLVQGDVWRYTGTDGNGAAIYQGYYGSQQMTVAAPDADGARVVTVTDPFHGDGTATQGTLNDVRGSARLQDGSEVYSGNFSGQQVNPTLNDHNLHTIAADLDITGNVITFGALTGNAATAGVTLQFQDTANGDGTYTGSFYSMLARPQAQWLWARAVSSSGQNTLPVMKLDATHKLTLYDSPASGETQSPGVVLDPKAGGVSTLRGVLRVRPGGDIDMGEFTTGGQP